MIIICNGRPHGRAHARLVEGLLVTGKTKACFDSCDWVNAELSPPMNHWLGIEIPREGWGVGGWEGGGVGG